MIETVDPHTRFVVREDLCTGCLICVIACNSIKHDLHSFSNDSSYIEVTTDTHISFAVRFTNDCDGCCYCLKFCAFDAIERPVGWIKEPHLQVLTRRHRAGGGATSSGS